MTATLLTASLGNRTTSSNNVFSFASLNESQTCTSAVGHFCSKLANVNKSLGSGTAYFNKNVNNYLNTNIYSYQETSGGQSSNLYLNLVHFFNTSVN
jgi:hypothetical protein